MSRFSVYVTNNFATAVKSKDIGDLLMDLSLSTLIDGGCYMLEAKMPAPWPISIPDFIGFNYKIEVQDSRGTFWSGRMGPPRIEKNSSGRWIKITARGYGANLSDNHDPIQNVGSTATDAMLQTAITALAPQISTIAFTATGFTLSATTINLERFTPAAFLVWAKLFGNSSYERLLLTVYPNNDGTIVGRFDSIANRDVLHADTEDFENVEFGGNESQLANRVTVYYNDGISSVLAEDTDLQGAGPIGWGLIKEAVLYINQISSILDATQAANAILAVKKALRVSTVGTITTKGVGTIKDSEGVIVPPWRVRAGDTFRWDDIDVRTATETNLALWNEFSIAESHYSEGEDELTITPESFEFQIERAIGRFNTLLLGRQQLPL